MSRYILSGATGFIGSHLLRRLLNEGHEVAIISRKTSSYKKISDIKDKLDIFEYDGDIEELINFYKKVKPDITVHLASLYITEHTSKEVGKLIDSNINFSTQLLEAMNSSGCKKIINTSTSWQHYNNENYNPINLYAATKEAFETIIKFYVEAMDFKCISLELFDTYGKNDSRNKILNLLSKYSAEKTILNMSKGEQILDLTYIDDVVEAYVCASDLLLAMDEKYFEKYMVSGERISLKNLVNLYEEKTGENIFINWGAREYRKREMMVPWSKGKILKNWKAKTSLEDGIIKAFKKG